MGQAGDKLGVSSPNHKHACHLLRGWEPPPAFPLSVPPAIECLRGSPEDWGSPAAWEINLGSGALGICDSGHLPAPWERRELDLGQTWPHKGGRKKPGLVSLSLCHLLVLWPWARLCPIGGQLSHL